ncbi:MAG: hypothetical protein NTY37_07410, partial [Methanothrix sp.]|nr:hypothetical protein [Methanothrix sp.]
ENPALRHSRAILNIVNEIYFSSVVLLAGISIVVLLRGIVMLVLFSSVVLFAVVFPVSASPDSAKATPRERAIRREKSTIPLVILLIVNTPFAL